MRCYWCGTISNVVNCVTAGVHVEKAVNSASLPVQARGSNGEMAEDMLQMALRMAEMQSEQTLDLEDAVDATPIRARGKPTESYLSRDVIVLLSIKVFKGRKRNELSVINFNTSSICQ